MIASFAPFSGRRDRLRARPARPRGLAACAAALLCLGLAPPPSHAATRTLAPLVQVDRLGYRCIPEDQLEIAFAASGKGERLPRTCLVDPCAVEPDEVLLAELLGRPPTEPEIEDFRQRHVVACTAQGRKFPPGYAPWDPILSTTPHVQRAPEPPETKPPHSFTPEPVPPIPPPVTVFFTDTPRPPPSVTVRIPTTDGTPATVFGGVPPRALSLAYETLPIVDLSDLGAAPPLVPLPPPAPVPLPATLMLGVGALVLLRLVRNRARRD